MTYDDGFSLVIGFIAAVSLGFFLAVLTMALLPSKRKKWNGFKKFY
jgi:hypothetical protein